MINDDFDVTLNKDNTTQTSFDFKVDEKNEEVKAMLRDVIDELVDVLIVWLMKQLMYFCLTSA